MANTNRVCTGCHLFGAGCDGKTMAPGETCPRYEHHLQWLVRQVDTVRHAESRARALAALSAVSLLLSFAAWAVLDDADGTHRAAQAHAAATKVFTASTSGANTLTR
ncbi:MAG TPA: hypothetical protein VMB75_04800 [Rhodocyclaceae bacterium]|nr:hypothetical protein [Rhodocyclaceae bacterium]